MLLAAVHGSWDWLCAGRHPEPAGTRVLWWQLHASLGCLSPVQVFAAHLNMQGCSVPQTAYLLLLPWCLHCALLGPPLEPFLRECVSEQDCSSGWIQYDVPVSTALSCAHKMSWSHAHPPACAVVGALSLRTEADRGAVAAGHGCDGGSRPQKVSRASRLQCF